MCVVYWPSFGVGREYQFDASARESDRRSGEVPMQFDVGGARVVHRFPKLRVPRLREECEFGVGVDEDVEVGALAVIPAGGEQRSAAEGEAGAAGGDSRDVPVENGAGSSEQASRGLRQRQSGHAANPLSSKLRSGL